MMYFRIMLMVEWSEVIFYTVLLLLIIYNLWRTIPLIFHRSPRPNPKKYPLSVIIAAHNEEENLRELIPLLVEQNYPAFEIIILLDRCTDKSREVVEKYLNEYSFINFLVISETQEGFNPKKYALKKGIELAKNEWMVLTDADCRPATYKWLDEINNHLDDKTDFILGYAPYFRENNLISLYTRYETFMTGSEYLSSSKANYPYMGVGRNLIYRKTVFIPWGFGHFRQVTGGDDDLFVHYKADGKRTKPMIGKSTLTFSRGKTGFSQYFIQKRRHYSVGKYYLPVWKSILATKYSLQLLLWISFIILALQADFLIILSFFGYFIVKGLLDWGASKKLGDGYSFWLGPFLDLFYSVFVPVAAGIASASKKVTWK